MKFKRIPLLAYLCLLPILLSLGFWQLDRSQQKQALLDLQAQQQTEDSIRITATSPDNLEALLYRPAKATGQYDNKHQFLLDNQVHNHKAGVLVLTPLRLKPGNKAILVNRGWQPLGNTRDDLPDVNVPNAEITVSGRINRFSRVGLTLEGADLVGKTWPALIQTIDINKLSKQLGYPLLGFQIELNPTEPHGFIRDWHKSSVMTPEKHLGYAVQWFLLALTLTVLLLKYGIDKTND